MVNAQPLPPCRIVRWPFAERAPLWWWAEYRVPAEATVRLQVPREAEGRGMFYALEGGGVVDAGEGETAGAKLLREGQWLSWNDVQAVWVRPRPEVVMTLGLLWTPDLEVPAFPSARPMSGAARTLAELLSQDSAVSSSSLLTRWRLSVQLMEKLLEPTRPVRTEDPAVAEALTRLTAVEEDYPTQAEIARAVGLSPSQFARRFQQAMGTNFRNYLQHARLGRARTLLEEGVVNVTEAAFEAGYGEVSQFTRAFRRHFGVTPSRVRGLSEDAS
jgi:AraC-like DNA-binding protein